jgi:ankyrin repeat protein
LNKKINQRVENLIEQSVIKRVFNKESMMYETQKIKSDLIKRANTKIDILFLYIKDGNHQNFKDIFQKFNPGIEEKDEKGNSFLNLSVQCCYKAIIEFLIDKGANINSQNKKLNTPLHYALSYQNYDIADLLLRFGADENIKNIDGLTPYQCLKYEHSIE